MSKSGAGLQCGSRRKRGGIDVRATRTRLCWPHLVRIDSYLAVEWTFMAMVVTCLVFTHFKA